MKKIRTRYARAGMRVGYSQGLEMSSQSHVLTKKYWFENVRSWSARAKIAQLLVKRPCYMRPLGSLLVTTMSLSFV